LWDMSRIDKWGGGVPERGSLFTPGICGCSEGLGLASQVEADLCLCTPEPHLAIRNRTTSATAVCEACLEFEERTSCFVGFVLAVM
jgi:hypothetical protein